jgi:hypothetical protein
MILNHDCNDSHPARTPCGAYYVVTVSEDRFVGGREGWRTDVIDTLSYPTWRQARSIASQQEAQGFRCDIALHGPERSATA